MKFRYTALSGSGKKMSGLLEAREPEAAKEQLHKMGLSIIDLAEISQAEFTSETARQKAVQQVKGIQTFAFQASDNKGKPVDGTIDADNLFSAYKRLVSEYQFTLHNLFPADAAEAEKAQSQEKLKEMAQRYQAEKTEEEIEKESEDLEQHGREIDKQVVAEIDQVIVKAKEALKKHGALFSVDHRTETERKLGQLERVRQSNNLKHIAELCDELYERLRVPDRTEGVSDQDQTEFRTLLSQIGSSALINKQSALYQKAVGLGRIQEIGHSIMKSVQHLTESRGKGAEDKPKGLFRKWKARIHHWAEKKDKPLKEGAEPGPPSLGRVFAKLKAYLLAGNPVIRKTRKHELAAAWRAYREHKGRKKAPSVPVSKGAPEPSGPKPKGPSLKERGGLLLGEVDSFLSWLLAFYLVYLFLAVIAIEKGIGLPRDFVFRTLSSPVIVNVTLFLFISHFIFFIRNRFLKSQVMAGLFWMGLGYGGYLLLIVNF